LIYEKTEFKKIKRFFYFALPFILIAIFLSFFIDIKTVIIALSTTFLLIAYFIWKEGIGQEFFIALLFAISITSYQIYEYTTMNIMIGKINLFPLIAWTAGLVALREIYEKVNIEKKLIIFTLAYIPIIAILEYIGYNYLGIKLNSNYDGLLGLELIHNSLIMKAIYLTIGPIYLIITDYLKVK
jgi:hypothetical protein